MSIENDDIRDLLPAWALDAVDDDERALVEARLATDPELRAEADELLALTADLGDGDIAPPPSLKASVLDTIADTPQIDAEPPPSTPTATDSEPATVTPLAERRRNFVAPALLAAAAVLIVALIASMAFSSDPLRRDEQIAAVLDADDAVTITLDSSLGGPIEIVFSDALGDTVLSGEGITDPPEDRTYELWLIRPDASGPESLGIFAPTPAGDLEVLFLDVDVDDGIFAVSDEPAGGSPTGTPTGEILAVSEPPTA